MPGLLRIRGKLDVKQFWPKGTSDADTVNLVVDVNKKSFQFAEDGKTFKTTKVFFGAVAIGKGSKQVVSDKNKITIRLQGVDAPELHYKASPLTGDVPKTKRKRFNEANKERLQHWGETAATQLGKKIATFGDDTINCEFISAVDKPFDVTDVYGRFVGNVRVGQNFKLDINTWLVEQALAYPSFYDSMSRDEIETLLKAMTKGKAKKRVFKDYTKDTNVFFTKLLYRRPKKTVVIELRDDTGALLMPKVYRRQVTFRMQKKAGLVSGSLVEFLLAQKKPDQFHRLDEFMKPTGGKNAPVHNFSELFKGKTFNALPHEVVIREQGATLVDSKGREVDDFFP
jgi:endonuclease YncB( thermonuclease family)